MYCQHRHSVAKVCCQVCAQATAGCTTACERCCARLFNRALSLPLLCIGLDLWQIALRLSAAWPHLCHGSAGAEGVRG